MSLIIGKIESKESMYPDKIIKTIIPQKTMISTINIMLGFTMFAIKLLSSFIVTLYISDILLVTKNRYS